MTGTTRRSYSARRLVLGSVVCALIAAHAQGLRAQVGRIGTQIPKQSLAVTPPTNPSSPSPTDSATGISTLPILSWSGGCVGATSYGVIGPNTTNPPTTDHSGLVSATYTVTSALSNSTTYYWQPYCSNAGGNNSGKATPTPIYSFTVTSGAAAGVLQLANLSVAGCFITYGSNNVGGVAYSNSNPLAMRRIGGVRHWYEVSYDGDMYEFVEPTLKSCSTALASLNKATLTAIWTGLSGLHNKGSQQSIGVTCNGGTSSFCGYVAGAAIDPSNTDTLWINWSGWYTNIPANLNSFARLRMNTDHTLTVLGCYAYPDRQPVTGLGTTFLPASWVTSNLPAGRRIGLTGGILANFSSGNDYGPGLIAIPEPTDNAPCADWTDNLVSAGTVLAAYAVGANPNGPSCYQDHNSANTPSGSNMGCNPPTAPTTPYPARLASTHYSYDLYQADWEPWPHVSPTTGYFGDYSSFQTTWYDDGVKAAAVVPYLNLEGWIKTTVVSTTGPGQAVLTSIDTNDGLHLNPGDHIGINTCRLNIDPNCTYTPQDNYLSRVILDTVNVSTKAITFHLGTPDDCANHSGAGCTLTPQVGGDVFGGVFYHLSIPGRMRSEFRMQLFDPQQYVNVLSGSATYTPTYNEDFSLYALGITNLGDPSAAAGGVKAGYDPGGPLQVNTVVADPTAQQIIVCVHNADVSPGVPQSMCAVLDVSHTP